jgi:hypothetical protein
VFIYGDVNFYQGEVVDKYQETIGKNVYGAVDITIKITNQLNENIGSGNATVYLPFPGHGVKLPIPVIEKLTRER